VYSTANFFDKISIEKLAASSEIRNLNIRIGGSFLSPLIRPLTQADLDGNSVVRGVDPKGIPFIGFIAFDSVKAEKTIYTIFGHDTPDSRVWKICERAVSNTQDNMSVNYDSIKHMTPIDSDRLALLLPKTPKPSSAPVAPPRSQHSDLAEVTRLYPIQYLSLLGANNIAALPVVNLNHAMRTYDADADRYPDFHMPKPADLGLNIVIRGIDQKGTPFISYQSKIPGTICSTIHTIFQNGETWHIIKDQTPYDGYSVTRHCPDRSLDSVSDADLEELARILNSNVARPTPR
jgi:hypothetical protein